MKKVYILLTCFVVWLLTAEENFRDWKRRRDRLIQESHAEDSHLHRSKDELYYAKQDMEAAKDRNHYPEYWIMEQEYYQDQDHVFDDAEEDQMLRQEIEDY